MAKTWISPEAKIARSWVRGWVIGKKVQGQNLSFLPWIPPNFGGGVYEGKIQFQIQDALTLEIITIDLEMKKVDGNWKVINYSNIT